MSQHMTTPMEDARQTEDLLNAAADRPPQQTEPHSCFPAHIQGLELQTRGSYTFSDECNAF